MGDQGTYLQDEGSADRHGTLDLLWSHDSLSCRDSANLPCVKFLDSSANSKRCENAK